MIRLLAFLLLAFPAFAIESAQGWCQLGNQVVVTGGVNSTTKVQRSYPQCTISVFDAGTSNLSTIFSDSSSTPLANPFTANTNGYWYFYAANGSYSVQLSGGGLGSPITLANILLNDPNISNVSANRVYAGPASGSPAQPTFRLLVNGDLPTITISGDVTGNLGASVVAKINGTTVPASPSTHQIPVVTATNATTWKTLPNCTDTVGQHLNYTQSTDLFSCGTTGVLFSGVGAGTNANALVVGSGGSLLRSGTGIIDANKILGTTLTGLTGVIKMASGIPSVATAGTDYVSPTIANTYTAGAKQTMSQSATTAGLNLGVLSSNPSTPAQGDVWYNNGAILFRDSAASRTLATLTGSQTLTNKTVDGGIFTSTSTFTNGIVLLPASASATATTSAKIAYDTTADQLHVGIASADRILPFRATSTPTSGNCAQWGANGLLSVTGSPCGSGGTGVTEAALQSGTLQFCSDTGGDDTYVCGLSTALTAYTNGQLLVFRADTASTGGASLDVDSLGVKNVYASDGTSSPAISANVRYVITYDSSLNSSAGGWRMPPLGTSSSGALTLLEQHTASASATLDFTASISSTYDDYLVEFINVLSATNSVEFRMRVSTDGGSTYDGGANYGSNVTWFNTGGSSGAFTINQTTIRISGDTVSNDATLASIAGSYHLIAPGDTTRQKAMYGRFTNAADVGGGAFRETVHADGGYQPTTAYNAFQFYFSSGNIASGTIRVYGVAK